MRTMSVADKKLYRIDFREKLLSDFSEEQIRKILDASEEALEAYDVTAVPFDGTNDTSSKDLIEYFISAKRVEGRAQSTLQHYEYVLNRILKKTDVPFSRMSSVALRKCFEKLEKDDKLSANTRNGYREVCSSFFGFLLQEELINRNPMNGFAPIKRPKVKRKPFTQGQMAKIEHAAWDPDDSRDIAIISFLSATGCRVSEMCALDRSDIDFADHSVLVNGKGDKERRVMLSEVCEMYLSAYLAEREDNHPALFVSHGFAEPDRMTPSGIQQMLRRVGKKANVKNVHPHRFRRTLATNMLRKGMPIEKVATLLGHEKLDTTMIYAYIDDVDLRSDYRKFA